MSITDINRKPIFCEDCAEDDIETEATKIVIDTESNDKSYQCDQCAEDYIYWLRSHHKHYDIIDLEKDREERVIFT